MLISWSASASDMTLTLPTFHFLSSFIINVGALSYAAGSACGCAVG